MNPIVRLLRHAWLDAGDVARVLDEAALVRLTERIAASEARHGGELCLHVEAGLPASYLWRHWRRGVPIEDIVHERALAQFSRLRVWDTEHNNGVLIYLQLAEHQIEIVADRGVACRVADEHWRGVLAGLGELFRAGRHEEGLARVIDAVGEALAREFPADGLRVNELPDRPRLG